MEKTAAALLGHAVVGVGTFYGALLLGSALGVPFHTVEGLPWLMGGMGAAAVTMPVGGAAGACIVGHHARQDGRFWASYLGGLVGLPVGYGVATFGAWLGPEAGVPFLIVGALTPAFGSVVGYNLSRSAENQSGFWTERVEPPLFRTTAVDGEAGEMHVGLDCRLLSVRF